MMYGRHGDFAAPLTVGPRGSEAGASLELHGEAFTDIVETDALFAGQFFGAMVLNTDKVRTSSTKRVLMRTVTGP